MTGARRDSTGGGAVLVTGAAGFIGSHVCERLVARGEQVIGLDSFDDYYDPALKRRNLAALLDESAFELVTGDIRRPEDVEAAFCRGPVRAVVHLAARPGVRPSLSHPLLYEDVNVRGTMVVLERARRTPGVHVVHGSSSSVYGSSCPIPFLEDAPCDRPASPYAATKRSAEIVAHAFHHIHGLPITCLRFFTVYGPRQRPDMAIHDFTRRIAEGQPVDIYGDGGSRRDYTYVDDIVDGVVRALDRPAGYRIINLGTTATTELRRLVAMIGERLGKPVHVRHLPDQAGDVPITYASIDRARELLGYRPTTPIERGLDLFLSWYLATAEERAA